MMISHSRFLLASVAAVVLAACTTTMPQNNAPVVAGNANGSYNNSSYNNGGYNNGGYVSGSNTPYTPSGDAMANHSSSNPYGAQPYTPSSDATLNNSGSNPYVGANPSATSPYFQQASAYTPPPAKSTYVGNYAPVDKSATFHRVVSGDTVYNISKRYGIVQDDLRAWNNLSGNDIHVGQKLRVKPQGYSGGRTAAYADNGAVLAGSTHRVVSGDTVYNISKRYGISQDQLRQWNHLNGNDIQLGQVLRVSSKGSASRQYAARPAAPKPAPTYNTPVTEPYTPTNNVYTAPVAASNELSSNAPVIANDAPVISNNAPVVTRVTDTNTAVKPAATTAAPYAPPIPTAANNATYTAASIKDGITWQNPLFGARVSQAFGNGNRGVELQGLSRQNVVAAADGQVIFSGTGPRGYGNLIVVQHPSGYLTAYGQGENLLVKDKENVKRGQTLATLGSGGKLHFEIRQNGKPVNPTSYVSF